MLVLTPVSLFRLESCTTTTCSSLVKWQSSSSISVPSCTALQRRRKSRRKGYKKNGIGMHGSATQKRDEWQKTGGFKITKRCSLKYACNQWIVTGEETHCLKAAMVFSRFSPAPVGQNTNKHTLLMRGDFSWTYQEAWHHSISAGNWVKGLMNL